MSLCRKGRHLPPPHAADRHHAHDQLHNSGLAASRPPRLGHPYRPQTGDRWHRYQRDNAVVAVGAPRSRNLAAASGPIRRVVTVSTCAAHADLHLLGHLQPSDAQLHHSRPALAMCACKPRQWASLAGQNSPGCRHDVSKWMAHLFPQMAQGRAQRGKNRSDYRRPGMMERPTLKPVAHTLGDLIETLSCANRKFAHIANLIDSRRSTHLVFVGRCRANTRMPCPEAVTGVCAGIVGTAQNAHQNRDRFTSSM